MNRRHLIGTALLLSVAAGGVAVAAGDFGLPPNQRHAQRSAAAEIADTLGRPIFLASEIRERDRHAGRYAERHQRRHHGEDDDDEDGERSGRGAVPQSGPTDPNTPVPDNSLFNGKTRPKVQVQ